MVVCGGGFNRVGILDVVDFLDNVAECLWGLYVLVGFDCLCIHIMDVRDGSMYR